MPDLKVGLLGNMNANFFALARYLRDRGVSAEVLLFSNEFDHFLPVADAFDSEYQSFCRSVSWGSILDVATTSAQTVRNDLANYAVLVGCGTAPAYSELVGRRLDIFVPYGDDIGVLTSYRLVHPRLLRRFWYGVHLQRRGVRRCSVVHMERIPLWEQRYEWLRGNGERWSMGVPTLYTPLYDPGPLLNHAVRTQWYQEFQRIRAAHDLVVFYHTRHLWKRSENDPNHKGTDRLLRGLALFIAGHPKLRTALVTAEYGPDVGHSRQLIAELGIANHVFWFPKMHRKDLMVGLAMADVACGEFTHSGLSYGVVHEAQAVCRPLLFHRDDAFYLQTYPEIYPIMNARSAVEIAARLEAYVHDPDAHRRMGEAGRAWYDKYVVDVALSHYLEYFAR